MSFACIVVFSWFAVQGKMIKIKSSKIIASCFHCKQSKGIENLKHMENIVLSLLFY